MKLSPIAYNLSHPRKLLSKKLAEKIKSKFEIKDKKILDFGCGTGTNCSIFSANNYLGVDIDNKRLKIAKKNFPSYKFLQIKTNKIPVEDNSFDFIFICGVLHHIPDDIIRDYILEFERILKSKGKIIVFEPCLFSKYKLENILMKFFDEGKFIRTEKDYLSFFNEKFLITIYDRFRLIYFFRELYFTVEKKPISIHKK